MLSHFLLFGVLHWLMLLPSLLWQILLPQPYGRCYCHNSVVDVVTTCNIVLYLYCIGRCYCQAYCGRSYCQKLMADVIAILVW